MRVTWVNRQVTSGCMLDLLENMLVKLDCMLAKSGCTQGLLESTLDSLVSRQVTSDCMQDLLENTLVKLDCMPAMLESKQD